MVVIEEAMERASTMSHMMQMTISLMIIPPGDRRDRQQRNKYDKLAMDTMIPKAMLLFEKPAPSSVKALAIPNPNVVNPINMSMILRMHEVNKPWLALLVTRISSIVTLSFRVVDDILSGYL